MEQRGYYSLVQYCPDLSRLEGVNIGVLIYDSSTQRLRLRVLKSHRRIGQFFGKQDWTFVDRLKNSLVDRLGRESFSSKDELQKFISKRANAIQLTPLQPVIINEIDQDIDKLFEELVSPVTAQRRKRIDRDLGERLLAAGVKQMVRPSVSVHFPFFDEPVRAPFGYQNGRFNLLAPVQFTSDLRDVIAKAGERAFEGKILYENPDPGLGMLCLNVVAKFPEEFGDQSKRLIENVLTEHHVKFYNFEDLSPLVEDIKDAAAHHASELGPTSR
jgi:hypothetical protein